jgi:hypothetical protein
LLWSDPASQARDFALPSLPARWKGIHSRDGFKNSNDLGIPRQVRDKFLLLFRHKWRRIKSEKFFVLFVKLAIFKRTAKSLPEYFGEFLRCAWGQIDERSHSPKNPRHEQNLTFYPSPRESLDFWQIAKLSGTMSFGNL